MNQQIINEKDELFIVTSPESGWDCVHGTVYAGYTKAEVREILDLERGESTEDDLIIHEIYNINQKNTTNVR